MKKIYRKLTKDQRERKVYFSSALSTQKTELSGDTIHEITEQDYIDNPTEAEAREKRLLDDRWFNDSPWKYNIIRR